MKKFNIEEFISLLILILLTLYIGYLLFTGQVYNYLSEKTAKILYIAIVILPILVIGQVSKVFTFNGKKDSSNKFLPILFSLVIAVLLLLKNSLNIQVDKYKFNSFFAKDAIEINHDTHHIIENIDKEGEEYLGKYIIFTGFVEEYTGEKFILGREEMNCCAADSYVIGIQASYSEKFKEKQWIKALGRIQFDGEYYLLIEEAIKIDEPNNLYF